MVELSTLHGETQFLAFRAADALSSLEEFRDGAWSVSKFSSHRDSHRSSQLKQAHAHEALTASVHHGEGTKQGAWHTVSTR